MKKRFDIKVIGFIEIQAENEEEALDKLMDEDYKISDLRWKQTEIETYEEF